MSASLFPEHLTRCGVARGHRSAAAPILDRFSVVLGLRRATCVNLQHIAPAGRQSDEEAGSVSDVEFLTELAAFLRLRWKAWLQPILIVLLIIGAFLLLANQLLSRSATP